MIDIADLNMCASVNYTSSTIACGDSLLLKRPPGA